MEAIFMVESANGKYKIGRLDLSYGIGQLKLSTARDMAKMLNITLPKDDAQLKQLLIKNDKLNIQLSTAYFGWLFHQFNDLDLSIISYNSGIGNVINKLKKGEQLPVEYLNKVKKKYRGFYDN